jgi:hypothetical protein
MRRLNEWCEDLLEAVFCEYFPTFLVGLVCLLALFGAGMIMAQVLL